MDRPLTLAEVVRRALGNAFVDVHTALPARVNRYDSSAQMVDVQPLIKSAHTDEEQKRVVSALPVVVNVPVQFPRGGRFRLTLPVQEGDTGLLIFSEASLDVWLATGGVVDPLDDRRMNLSDAIFIPGVGDSTRALASAPTDRLTLGDDIGLQVHISTSQVNLGSNLPAELDKVALSTPLRAFLTTLVATFNAHTHATAAPGPPSVPVPILTAAGTFESSAVQAKK